MLPESTMNLSKPLEMSPVRLDDSDTEQSLEQHQGDDKTLTLRNTGLVPAVEDASLLKTKPNNKLVGAESLPDRTQLNMSPVVISHSEGKESQDPNLDNGSRV